MKTTIQEYERGVLFERGNPARLLAPGRHRHRRIGTRVERLDLRPVVVRVSGQEALTSDGISIKLGATLTYRIVDPLVWVAGAQDGQTEERIYLDVQLALRDAVMGIDAAQLLTSRTQLTRDFAPLSPEAQAAYGVEVVDANIRDLTFPGDLKAKFAQVAVAKQEALAQLERARGEQATLRSLANAAKLIEANPELRALRTLIALEKGGGQVVVSGA